MPRPDDLPDCQYRDPYANPLGSRCHCRHDAVRGESRSLSVLWSQCVDCPLTQPGSPISQVAVPVLNCTHRSSEPIHYEACTCGSAAKIAIYKCDLHKRCVPAKANLKSIADLKARKACQCCEGCPDQAVGNRSPNLRGSWGGEGV